MLKSLRLRVQPLGAAALILFASALQASAVTVTVTDPTPTLKAEKTGCCFDPECPKCSIWAGLPTATDTLDDAIFGYAWDYWNNEPGDPKGWALVKGGVLNGSFNIAVYDAGFTTTTPPCKAGVEIKMYYAPGSGDPSISDVVWAQAIATNVKPEGAPGPGNPYLDIRVDDDPGTWEPPVYPHRYPDGSFYDYPDRYCPTPCGEWTYWSGYVYLTQVDYNQKTLTVYEGVRWSFEIDCLIPEPATSLVLSLSGLVVLVCRRRR